MGMSQSYGPADETESLATIAGALDGGVTFFDTADVYGDGHNEELLGRGLGSRRDEVVVATKFALSRNATGMAINGHPDYVRSCCDASLRRLNTDRIDLYYQHRVDPTVPIEDTVGAMAELVAAGKVRYLGLSEASSRSIERASAVHPIAALQSEWSLWSRDLEDEVLATARRLNIGIVPFSPLGRGFLSGAITSVDDFGPDDFRRHNPRFQGENFTANLRLVDEVKAMAADKSVLPAQLALAWIMSMGDDVAPIPGTKRVSYLEQNLAASSITLSDTDLERLAKIAPPGVAAGGRYPGDGYAYGDSPEGGSIV
jgi:aryl-alcohol dehydrogenase-like predicted oxidoreductase